MRKRVGGEIRRERNLTILAIMTDVFVGNLQILEATFVCFIAASEKFNILPSLIFSNCKLITF